MGSRSVRQGHPLARIRGRGRGRRQGALALGLLSLGLGLGACSSTDSPAATATSATSAASGPSIPVAAPTIGSPSTTTSAADAAAIREVTAAWRRMWDTYQVAFKQPNPDDPALAGVMTGAFLAQTKATLTSMKAAGATTQGYVSLTPPKVRVDLGASPQTAEVTECVDDSHVAVVSSSGTDSDPTAQPRTSTLTAVKQGGTWLFDAKALGDRGPCAS